MNTKVLVDCHEQGRKRTYEFVKNVAQVTNATAWFDLTGSSGNPKAKQWFDAAPLQATVASQSSDGGIFHGSSVTADGYTKYIRSFNVSVPAGSAVMPMPVMLMDCLLYYPTIEDGTLDEQVMDNTQTLTRYTDGKGVQMMAVVITARTGGQNFIVKYTNQDGVEGRTTPLIRQSALTIPGTIATVGNATANSTPGPFLPLQNGDTGVRKVESVTMQGIDTGFFAIVLVRPLATTILRESSTPYFKDMLLYASEMETIQDDAYLSLLCLPNGSLNGLAVRGSLTTIFN